MTFPVGVEFDIAGTWTDVTKRARRVPVTITRGRADEASQVAPTAATVVFDNTDGALSPRNPTSQWYPNIHRGMPCRISVRTGTPYLLLSGAAGGRATTPDNAALDITGDLFIAAELLGSIHMPAVGTRHELAAKWNSTGNQRSYHFGFDDFGRLVLFWSTDGTTIPAAAVSEYSIPFATAGPCAFAVHLDVNVAGTSHQARFWGMHGTLAELLTELAADETAMRLGAPYTASGTTSIFNSTTAFEIGDITGGADVTYQGGVRRVQVRSGDWTGTIAANPDFTTQTVGAASFTDSATRVWSIQGDASITDRQTRFVGTTSSIALGWPKATERTSTDSGIANATFTVAGLLRQLQQGAKPLNSTLRRLVTSPSVAANVIGYWPMEEEEGATQFASPIPNVRPMTDTAGMDLASDADLVASLPLPMIPSGSAGQGFGATVPSGSTTVWAVECFVHIPTAAVSPAFHRVMGIFTNGTIREWRVRVNDTNVNLEGYNDDGGLSVNSTFAIDPSFYNQWTLVRFDGLQNGGNIDWDVNYVPLDGSGTAFGTGASIAGTLGRVTRVGNFTTGGPGGIALGHYIVTTGLGLGWLAGGDTAWVGETAAHRVWRLCREERIPILVVGDNTMVDFFRGNPELSETMGPQLPKTLPELLQECADTDVGILYEQRSVAGLAFRTHKSLQNQTVKMALDLAQQGLAAPFDPVLDDQRFRNDITVKRPAGSEARAVDQGSVDDEGRYDEAVEANVKTDERLPDQASWRLHLGTWPELRLPAIATTLAKAGPPVIADWLDVDLGDRFEATNLMRQYDRDVALLLEGYDETLSVFNWEASIVGSPAGPWEVGVRNDATFRGKRDTAGSQLSANVTSTATSLSVATTLGPLWSAVDADDGFDIAVGGEQMTVTDISGTTSPQTFTVTRSKNGVVKAHSSGADVRLWRPTIREL